MPSRILIVPDKFKGTLTAARAADAIAQGWRRARPGDQLELLPMSDGGDGFGEVISEQIGAQPQTVETVNAAHLPITATWWWDAKTQTAVVESANVIGLAMLPVGKFHPFELDTFGLGAVIEDARSKGTENFLIGIGGSATNDGGFGLAHSLGWKFGDNHGHPVERWTELYRLACVQPPEIRSPGKMIVAVDVQNRLLGQRGATRVYGPQKGIRPVDFDLAERCLERLATVMKKQFESDFAQLPGSGAAGGLGFGLFAFMDAQAESGFELFARYANLDARLRGADLVITGEGAIDRSTLMGKGVGQVAQRCTALKIPCIGLAGSVVPEAREHKSFTRLAALTDLTSAEEAKSKPEFFLMQLAESMANDLPR